MPAPHHSVFYRPDALSATQPTVLKHYYCIKTAIINFNRKTVNIYHSAMGSYIYTSGSAARPVLVSPSDDVSLLALCMPGVCYLQTVSAVAGRQSVAATGQTADCWVPRQLSDTADNGGKA